MIINHNITALNTHRQLSTNTANQSKSIEKLSSGLRINRAGDDAAGLAISEKMRGQIRGLDQASRNAQDGISLIQTAEGALNETHDILQRMKELATQAANDTNTTNDRGEIQKEINQLTSEINRIGDTTEFNTQKLLKGATINGSTPTVGATTLTGGGPAVPTAQVVSNTFTGDNVDATDSFTVGGETYTMVASGGSGTNVNVGADLNTSISNLAAAINGNSSSAFTAVADGGKLTITQKTAATGTIALTFTNTDTTNTTTAGTANVDTPYAAGSATAATGTITFDATTVAAAGTKITVDGKTYELYNSDDNEDPTAGNTIGIDIKGATSNTAIIDKIVAAEAGANSGMVKGSATTITVTATATGTGGNALTTSVESPGAEGYTATLQIGANQGQSFKVQINDMRAAALGISGTAGAAAVGVGTEANDDVVGAKFTATGAANDLSDVTKTGEHGLDVSDAKKASAAIKVFDQAIASVSSERSKLGAFQNRLEHTINNLKTSSENLTSAESRVRDVDMAKEMMNQTKSSILSQAAQAMLAQANQQPQGVLQLLR